MTNHHTAPPHQKTTPSLAMCIIISQHGISFTVRNLLLCDKYVSHKSRHLMSLVRQANQLFPSRSQFVVDLLSSAVESMEDSNDCVLSCPLEIDTDRVMARIEAALLHPFQHDLVAAASGTAGYALHRCVVCLIVSSVN